MKRVFLLLVLGFLFTPRTNAGDRGRLDDGLLDPTWFGAVGEFRETENVDFLWVKPGFSLQGHTLQITPWQDFVFLRKEKRDTKDAAKAGELTELMASRIRGALSSALDGRTKISRDEGDLSLVGRFVEVNAGSKAAKWLVGFGAGSATATWDIKIVDNASGETLAAIHHRSISGTNMSEIDDKIIKWLDRFAIAMKGDLTEYATGKRAK